ncbi:arginine--tRNA ligase [Patescibacteria group bacterium]|nr:arginine--tRNA ligase [Patescibacteria group bacterium]MBU4511844.1 arginine--tRNA ligase [Patescibacteria group bacterium]MCG2693470.1 arginine--tRNA ligase [Candidatus Parcubacteria bacterium]
MKSQIIKQLQKVISKKYPSFCGEIFLEYPPDSKMGDLGFPCFELAKVVKKSPNEVAKELAGEFKSGDAIDKAQAIGPYLNFFLNKDFFWEEIFERQAIQAVKPPASPTGGSSIKRVMVEFSSPNTNKPLHLGHVRNNVLGDSVSRLLKSQGHKVIRASLVNDRGIHICKSMLAYQKVQLGKWKMEGGGRVNKVNTVVNKVNNSRASSFPPSLRLRRAGKLQASSKKGDHLVGDYYVLYSQQEKKNPELNKEAQAMLKKWETGDKETIKLWKKMNKMVLAGFNETYERLGVSFDKTYFESQEYEGGREIIKKILKKGKCYKRKDGAIEIDLTKYSLDKKVLLRADGTSVYITQDIGLAVSRQKDLKLDKIIYVVANEQDYHFKVLFKALELFGYKWAKNLYHLNYAMVNLPTGKMKSREGTAVDADDLMDETTELAGVEIRKREKGISKKELKARACKIGLGAMKFYLLKNTPSQTILYNPKESISFEGATGPYLQYTYARIQSILRKSISKKQKNNPSATRLELADKSNSGRGKTKKQLSIINYQLLDTDEEWEIGSLLARFNEVVKESASELNPAELCTYLLDLASAFNTFYHKHPVLKAKNQDTVNARLTLIDRVAKVIKLGLELLGIEVVEKM